MPNDNNSVFRVSILADVNHYQYAAQAAARHQILRRFITGVALTRTWQKSLIQRIPIEWQKRLSGRVYEGLPAELVISIPWPAILETLLLRLAWRSPENAMRYRNILFDLIGSAFAQNCNLFHFVASEGLFSARRAKSQGATLICDERGAHPRYQERLLRQEYEKLGVRYVELPGWSYLARREQEYELADYIIVASEHASDSFVAEGISRDKLIILPYGVDLSSFRQLPKSDDTFRVIFVGQIFPRKGLHYLVQAFEELRPPHAELVVIGGIDPSMQSFVAAHHDSFTYMGRVPNRELYRHLSNASVLVLPSISDAFGLVVLEAMACGLPVIVTDNCGAQIENGVHGFVIPIRDVEALKDRLSILYENEPLRLEMGAAAKLHAQEFTWERYGERLIAIYGNIAAQQRKIDSASQNTRGAE